MKNVFKRGLQLLTLFSSNNDNMSTDFIKDNILDYRELGDSAFKRSFERDKALLKEMGYLIEFVNDKWKLSDGYSILGTRIIEEIKKSEKIDTDRFISVYQLIKQYFNLNYEFEKQNINISKIVQAINEKRRISYKYNTSIRKVYPLGLRQYDGQWYLGVNENSIFKTFKLNNIEDLKIGSIPDLHNLENIKINFSWEESVTPTSLIIKLHEDSYIVNKNKFNHKVKNKNINQEILTIELETFDLQGLIQFLLLTESEIIKISDTEKNKLLEYINE
jgi:predicted DNA-binding transcriptional regulator YafY|tara:strand:- start:3158 stop:3985 length:828 start_codon:yes stop_codon:yes gene_type:complete